MSVTNFCDHVARDRTVREAYDKLVEACLGHGGLHHSNVAPWEKILEVIENEDSQIVWDFVEEGSHRTTPLNRLHEFFSDYWSHSCGDGNTLMRSYLDDIQALLTEEFSSPEERKARQLAELATGPWAIKDGAPEYYEKIYTFLYGTDEGEKLLKAESAGALDPYDIFIKKKEMLGEKVTITKEELVVVSDEELADVGVPAQLKNVLNLSNQSDEEYQRVRKKLKESSNYFAEHLRQTTAYMEKLPELLLRVDEERVRLAVKKASEVVVQLSIEKAVKLSTHRVMRAVAKINADTNSKWVIVRDEVRISGWSSDRKTPVFRAITRKPITVKGAVDGDKYALSERDWNYGYCEVLFDYTKIRGIYVNGIGIGINACGDNPHPHLGDQGRATMCMGNLSTTIMDCIRGKAIKIAGEQKIDDREARRGSHTTMWASNDVYKQAIAKVLLGDATAIEPPYEMIEKMSWFYTINDIEKLLEYFYTLLKSVSYVNPYVRLWEENLDDIARRGGDDGEDRFDDFEEAMGSAEEHFYNGLPIAVEQGLIPKEEVKAYLEEWKNDSLNMSDVEREELKEILGLSQDGQEETAEESSTATVTVARQEPLAF